MTVILRQEPDVLPLDDVKVVDLTRVLSGPYCTMVLADLGAEVIKIERFPGGDDSRRYAPQVDGESYCFAMANRNKRSLAIDLKSDEGREVVLRLIDSADVVVENFRPGVTSRLGLDYETVRGRKQDIIYCSISGFGQTGPYRSRPGYDIIAQGISGFLRMTGEPGGEPVKVGISMNDIAAGTTGVQAILAAYIHRLKSGVGQYIDISLVDSALAWTVWEAGAFFGSGEVPAASGTRHRRNAPYQAYRTSDGYVTVGGNNDGFWQLLCRDVIGRPELLDDPRYSSLTERLANVDALQEDLESVLKTRPTAHWVARMDAAGVPGGPVLTYDQTLSNEHVLARDMVQTIDHPIIGTMKVLGPPIRLSETPPTIRTPAPWLGQHSGSTLAELGMSGTEIDRLFEAGVIHDASHETQERT